MTLTPREIRLAIYALRTTVAQFSVKEDWNPEDWPAEQAQQRDTRRLLNKLERSIGIVKPKEQAA